MQDRAEQLWLVTIRMAMEAKKKGINVDNALALLRNAKSMLNEAHLDEDSHFLATKAEAMIEEAQREIFINTSSMPAFEKKWNDVITRVQRGEKFGEYVVSALSFYPDLPRGERWVRLPTNEKLSISKARKIAAKHGVEFKPHEKGHFILTGDRKDLKRALDDLSKYYRGG